MFSRHIKANKKTAGKKPSWADETKQWEKGVEEKEIIFIGIRDTFLPIQNRTNMLHWTSSLLFCSYECFVSWKPTCQLHMKWKILKYQTGGWRCVKHAPYALTGLTLRGTSAAKRKTSISIFSSSSFWVDLLQPSSVGFPDAGLSSRPAPPSINLITADWGYHMCP